MFKPVDPKVSFPKMEEKIITFWKDHDIFQKSIDSRSEEDEYIFFDGPPFATGLPHFGHFVPGTIKDVFPRYQTMKGRRVPRRFGWDCHGLPVEYEMEKTLGISGKSQIEEYGIGNFNEKCRSIVLRYASEWERIVTRMGRWVDFEHDYKTMDLDYMESIWWVFKRLYEKGLVYEGYNIMPYSPALATPLSNFEVNLGGYQDVVDPAVTVRFALKDTPDTYFLAWTTTPWTLPSNLALVVGPEVQYAKVKDGEEYYILAKSKLSTYYKDESEYELIEEYSGRDLEGIEYEPLFPYFAQHREKGAFRTFTGDYVTDDEGSGIVHTAPGFGEDDYNILKGTGIPVECPIDAECNFTSEVSDFAGLFVKDADKPIITWLKENGKLVKRENYRHSYPFCYRTKKPLIYRALSSWFVDVDKIKPSMLNANDKIKWVPEHLQKGRFGKWLEGARDWSISRNRFWGNPIPVWKCDGSDYLEVIGSREELEKKSGHKVTDLHKHFVDEITWPSPDGKGTMRRIPDVLDCWFESGAMPYAQNHYPFENKEEMEQNFPADFICEGLDQTRGWFYTLTILAAALFDQPVSWNIVTNGLVLAADGKKMSKSDRNYSDPVDVINEFGADALRFFLMDSAVVRAEDLKYTDDGVRDVLKNFIIPLWNAYSFFVTYANIDMYEPEDGMVDSRLDNPLDRWIISESEGLVGSVSQYLDDYDIQKACQPIKKFMDVLNNWYIRRSRRRFWRSENDADKKQAYDTLYTVLMKVIHTAAPFIPFITEEIFLNLRTDSMEESIHLQYYPEYHEHLRDYELEKKMELTQQAVSMGRALRASHSLKTRQPLKALYLVTKDDHERQILQEMEEIIKEELNVKSVIFRQDEEDLVHYSAKANYKQLGRTLGKDMKEVAQLIQELSMEDISSILSGEDYTLSYSGGEISLDTDAIVVQRTEKEHMKVLNEGNLTIGLDSEITEELMLEGLARDLIRSVQNLRKDSGLEVTDRIVLYISGDQTIEAAVSRYKEYISKETLARFSTDHVSEAYQVEVSDHTAHISLIRDTDSSEAE
ncbi:MAG: isoleucine--tRNA ligase [Spirochaetota bacterium]